MDQATFQSFLKTVIIILFVYYLFKFLVRLLAPFLMKKAMNKIQDNFQKQADSYFNQSQNQESTNASQSYQSTQPKFKEKKKVGEYIDYEEV